MLLQSPALGLRALGVLIVLQVIHKTLFAPLVITVATNALFAATTAAFLVHLVLRLGTIKKNRGEALVAASWAHPLGLLMAVLIGIALVAGYAGVAAFISLRVIVAAAVFGALFLLLVITQTLFASINEQTPKGQMLAENLGIDPRTLGLGGALLSALIRVLLIATSFLLIIGPWEVSTADLFDTVRNIPFGFKIGEIRVSFQAILAAILVMVLLLVLMRIIQRWLERELLPRTGLEPSSQLSIVTIFGYVGAITAIALALSGLGFDLQIALIAGALSVGIGFGLQSIVSNFVSGLILLTERPIRVGDSIVVKGEETGPARAGARDRDRDVRPRERHHPELRVHHRRRQELDARKPVGPDRGQGRGQLRDRSGSGPRHPDRHSQCAPADRSDPPSRRLLSGLRRNATRIRAALRRGGGRERPVGQERTPLRHHPEVPRSRHRKVRAEDR